MGAVAGFSIGYSSNRPARGISLQMTLFLASVRTADEAAIALRYGADIIDVKDPEAGALGAAPLDDLERIVRRVDGRAPVSATIGDPPMPAGDMVCAVRDVFARGADIAKIGLSGDGSELAGIARCAASGENIVAVMFADQPLDLAILPRLRDAGAAGVMLDTAAKNGGSLLNRRWAVELEAFVAAARSARLACGLAGSLKLDDVPRVLAIGPDIIGFRGALCGGGERTGALDPVACRRVRDAIPTVGYVLDFLRAKALAPI